MNESFSWLAAIVFAVVVGLTLGLSFYLGRRAGTAQGYFAAHGQIPWFVNGIAFAGDYLSAASFLGICGMIAFFGYDGFLYSIGYLAGWIVALFVIAEPMKRRGKFTFADCLDSQFHSRGIKLAAGLSTLAVSLFYLIPQMVGAGVLVQPLLGLPHWVGVVLVGTIVILIVVTAGMVSTTWVQFIKGTLLVVFSFILTVAVLWRGLETQPDANDNRYQFHKIGPIAESRFDELLLEAAARPQSTAIDGDWRLNPELWPVYREAKLLPVIGVDSRSRVYSIDRDQRQQVFLRETQTVLVDSTGTRIVNGQPPSSDGVPARLQPTGHIERLPGNQDKTGPLSPWAFLSTLQESQIVRWTSTNLKHPNGDAVTIYRQVLTPGNEILRPGVSPTFAGIRGDRWQAKIDFVSLMLALFCGTASLPHILIRYYTVKDEAAARKSTIVGIASIGSFYVLTLFLGLGAMTSGALDITDSNMAAPLLARSISEWLFAIISAIAFTTVLGTVSGLILAAAGAVAHDLLRGVMGMQLSDYQQVRIAKFASVLIGIVAMVLGILFAKLNVNYLVGWAFSVAASANLPALVMLLFWKRTTRQGVIASVLIGMISSLAWILLSGDTYSKVYGLSAESAWVPFSQPGIVTIPLSFLTLVAVSLMTQTHPNSTQQTSQTT